MKEALQKALDALGPTPPDCCGCQAEWQIAIDAIKEALAHPEQPPYHHFVSDRFNIDPQTGNLNIGAVKKQEPVAWISPKELLVMRGNAYAGAKDWRVNLGLEPEEGDIGLYTTPSQRTWVGLTDEEIDAIYEQHHNQYGECESVNFGYERAIEAKLRSKNESKN
jgi:hypothetical protein